MKFLFSSIFFSLCLYSAEIDRIESIIKDIEVLREDYLECKKELSIQNTSTVVPQIDVNKGMQKNLKEQEEELEEYKLLLKKEKKKNFILISKMDLMKNNDKADKILNNLKNILKTKEKEIDNLKNEILILNKNKENDNNTLVITKKEETIEEFTPSTFRMDKNIDIYGSVEGNIVDNWKRGRFFTSNIMTKNWIKITGYFLNDMWVKSKDELWIKKENITKR